MQRKILLKTSLTVFAMSSFMFLAFFCNHADDKGTADTTSSTQADTSAKSAGNLKPANPKPDLGKDLTDPMAVVIEKLKSYNAPPLVSFLRRKHENNHRRQMRQWL